MPGRRVTPDHINERRSYPCEERQPSSGSRRPRSSSRRAADAQAARPRPGRRPRGRAGVRCRAASASSAAAPPDFAPFARTWAGHDESLVIHANGQFLLTVWNSGDPASSSGNLTSTPGDEAIGEATQATAEPPVPKGGRIIISLDAQTDSVSVSAVNFDSETVRNVSFCGPEAPPATAEPNQAGRGPCWAVLGASP